MPLLCHCLVVLELPLDPCFCAFFVILGVILESDVILELFRNLALCSEITKNDTKMTLKCQEDNTPQ